MIDEFTSVADNVLSSLRSQRGVLKGAHRKALDVAASLGLSSTMMRVIERRTTADKILVYGGMVAVTMLLLGLWWFR
jgi:Golgi SNAP receptor complex protein 2